MRPGERRYWSRRRAFVWPREPKAFDGPRFCKQFASGDVTGTVWAPRFMALGPARPSFFQVRQQKERPEGCGWVMRSRAVNRHVTVTEWARRTA